MTAETYGPRTAAWRALTWHSDLLQGRTIRSLFVDDPGRFKRFSLESEGLLFDFSRQLLDARALELLLELAEQTEVRRWIELMFSGFPVNNTEDRPALHVALRRPADQPLLVDGEDVMPLVEAERRKMRGSPTRCTRGSSRATRAGRSPTSSTSASAARISASSWPCSARGAPADAISRALRLEHRRRRARARARATSIRRRRSS